MALACPCFFALSSLSSSSCEEDVSDILSLQWSLKMDGMQVPPRPAAEDLPPNINAGDGLCIMTWVLLGTSTVFVGGRIMSKMFVLRRFRWDDVFMLLTWVRLALLSHPANLKNARS